MKKSISILLVSLVVLVIAGYLAIFRPQPNLDQFMPMPPGGNFSLSSINGEVELQDYKGKLVLLYFGYTYCPDVCPTALALTSAALKQLTDEELAQVQLLFISVDPKRDSLERLAEYTQFFHENMLGITGSKAQIDDVAKRFGAYYEISDQVDETGGSGDHEQVKIQSGMDKGMDSGYAVAHTSKTVLLGKKGKIQHLIQHGTLPDEITRLIREYL